MTQQIERTTGRNAATDRAGPREARGSKRLDAKHYADERYQPVRAAPTHQ
jgi:hypothetical protein